ncbi:MAG: 2-oxoacid:acceptor oxidoreductase family protein [Acutalibacteraceae bacterium]
MTGERARRDEPPPRSMVCERRRAHGVILLDSLIDVKVERDDVTTYYVPASKLAEENGLKGLANIILIGKLFKEVGFCAEETLDKALQKCIPARKADMLGFNRKAIELGRAQ